MFRLSLLAIFCVVCVLPAVVAGPAPVAPNPNPEKNPVQFLEFPASDQTKLRAGETVVWSHCLRDSKKVSVLSAILLPVPPQDAWKLIDDKEGACEYISDLEKCKVIAKNGSEELVEQTTRPQGAPRSFTYTLRHEATFPTRMDFQRESGDLRDIQGSWIFDPVDCGAQTLLIYALHIDAGMLVPQRMIRRSQEKQLPDVLVAIRNRLATQKESGFCCQAPEDSLTIGAIPALPVPVQAPVTATPIVPTVLGSTPASVPVVATPIVAPAR